MDRAIIAAISVVCDGACETPRIVDEMIGGAAVAGASSRHFLVTRSRETADRIGLSGTEWVSPNADLSELMATIENAEQVIIGLEVDAFGADGGFNEFRERCYADAKWVTLADLAGKEGIEIEVAPGARLADFCLPLPRRKLSAEHRGVTVVSPPSSIPDHEDSFMDNSFFLIEETMRIMGFMPAGRILATGLYDGTIEENPMLREQAFELGRRLAAGAMIIPR